MREIGATECLEILLHRGERISWFDDDCCDHFLTVKIVRRTHNRNILHRRVPQQSFFHLARTDIETASNNKILFPSGDEHVSIVVDVANIAGVKPLLGKGLSLARIVVQISRRTVRSAHKNFTILSRSNFCALDGTNFNRSFRNWNADGAVFRSARTEVGCN